MVIDLLLKRAAEPGRAGPVRDRRHRAHRRRFGRGKRCHVEALLRNRCLKAKSVIIAAGGFVMNPDMVAKYTAEVGRETFVLGNTYDDGLGIRMGESAGGATEHMDQIFITAPPYPPSILLTGNHREQAGSAVRCRRFLPFPDLRVHHGPAGQRGIPDRRRGAF